MCRSAFLCRAHAHAPEEGLEIGEGIDRRRSGSSSGSRGRIVIATDVLKTVRGPLTHSLTLSLSHSTVPGCTSREQGRNPQLSLRQAYLHYHSHPEPAQEARDLSPSASLRGNRLVSTLGCASVFIPPRAPLFLFFSRLLLVLCSWWGKKTRSWNLLFSVLMEREKERKVRKESNEFLAIRLRSFPFFFKFRRCKVATLHTRLSPFLSGPF